MEAIRVSIVTINKNNSKGLESTIKSVISQSYAEIEYIVVDGNSKDDSSRVIEKFKPEISVVIQEDDRGIYEAMNKGISQSTGEYLLFLNSGDYFVRNNVIEMIFKAHHSGIAKFLYGNLIKNYSDRSEFHKGFQGKEIKRDDLLTGSLFHPATFIHKSIFEQYGFYDTELKIVSDWKLFLIAIGLNSEKAVYVDVDVSCFDMNGISNQNKQLAKSEMLQVLESFNLNHLPNKTVGKQTNIGRKSWIKNLITSIVGR